MPSTSIAFLGLGNMGGGMAARLAGAGYPLAVWNRNPRVSDRFRDLGATVANSPGEAAKGADVVLSMVADDAAARAVWLGESGALASMQPGTVLVECSTISPSWVDELSLAATRRRCVVLDAPVTGSKTQAASGELLFLVGGDLGVLDQVRPILAVMSRDIVHFGPTGSGARMKLINNFVCGAQAAALAEGVALIEKSGLDRDAALAVLQNGAPGSPLVKAVSARMAAGDYAVHFKLALMQKDLSYAIAEAERLGLSLTTATTARALFDNASAQFGDADFSAVVEPIRQGRK